MDQEAEERQGLKTEESRSQDQTRRLQRQVRELEDELADVRRKESESSQRKQDMVCYHHHHHHHHRDICNAPITVKNEHKHYIYTHTHTILTAIFPGEPGLAGCPLNSPSPFIPGLCIVLGQA